jgi:hypothetical protein
MYVYMQVRERNQIKNKIQSFYIDCDVILVNSSRIGYDAAMIGNLLSRFRRSLLLSEC